MHGLLRKANLSAHISFSVGWFGAVAAFFAIAITGFINHDIRIITSCYIGMDLICWFVIVPATIGSLLTGIFQSVGTQWGLFKHYWIIAKLFLTLAATIVLVLHLKPITTLANAAMDGTISQDQLKGLRIQLIADAGAALLVLLVTIILSVYKPWGKVSLRHGSQSSEKRSWIKYVLISLITLVLMLFIILHLKFVGFKGH